MITKIEEKEEKALDLYETRFLIGCVCLEIGIIDMSFFFSFLSFCLYGLCIDSFIVIHFLKTSRRWRKGKENCGGKGEKNESKTMEIFDSWRKTQVFFDE